MKRNLRRTLVIFALIWAIAVVVFTVFRDNRKQPNVTFTGWSSKAGVTHAVFQYPPVNRTDPSASLFKWRYEVRMDFLSENHDGTLSTNSYVDSGGPSPSRLTGLQVPVPTGVVALTPLHAETALHRYWDILPLPALPVPKWIFKVSNERVIVPQVAQ